MSARVADRTRFTHRLIFVRPDKTHLVADFEAAGLVPELLPAHRVRELRAALAQADIVHAHSPVLAFMKICLLAHQAGGIGNQWGSGPIVGSADGRE